MVGANRGPFQNTAFWVTALLETEIASLNWLLDVDHPDLDPELRDSLLYKDRDLILRNCDQMLALVPLSRRRRRSMCCDAPLPGLVHPVGIMRPFDCRDDY